MKHYRTIIAFALIAILPSIAFAANGQDQRLITVTGDADIFVEPDEVVITVGIETDNMDLKIAKKENDMSAKRVIGIAKKNGIPSKHIQTDYIHIEPRYKHRYDKREFLGYFVKKNIVITLRQIENFEKVLGDILLAGANYVHGIQFRTTQLRKYKDKARSLAIKAAKEKATMMAAEMGQKIGRPQMISESHSGWMPYSSWGRRLKGFGAQNVTQEVVGGSGSGSAFAPGQIKVNAKVSVSFKLQ